MLVCESCKFWWSNFVLGLGIALDPNHLIVEALHAADGISDFAHRQKEIISRVDDRLPLVPKRTPQPSL